MSYMRHSSCLRGVRKRGVVGCSGLSYVEDRKGCCHNSLPEKILKALRRNMRVWGRRTAQAEEADASLIGKYVVQLGTTSAREKGRER